MMQGAADEELKDLEAQRAAIREMTAMTYARTDTRLFVQWLRDHPEGAKNLIAAYEFEFHDETPQGADVLARVLKDNPGMSIGFAAGSLGAITGMSTNPQGTGQSWAEVFMDRNPYWQVPDVSIVMPPAYRFPKRSWFKRLRDWLNGKF